MVKIIIIAYLVFIIWMAYEVWRAPLVDDKDNIIIPPKKLRNLFKIKNNNNGRSKDEGQH